MIVTATVLNVRSGPGTEFRVVDQLMQGSLVEPKEAHGDFVWVTPGGGWVHRAYLALPSFIAPPRGLEDIVRRFGQPGGPQCSAGRVALPEPLKLGWQNATVSRVACHVLMEELFTRVFRAIHQAGLWRHLNTFDGIYNKRAVKSGSKLSTHSWGISVDLNASTNRQGTQGDMDQRIVRIFEAHGFVWGGDFTGRSRDPMHFQYAVNY